MLCGFECAMASVAAAMEAHAQFLCEFRAGRRVFGRSRFPTVVVVDEGDHVCDDGCHALSIGYTKNKPTSPDQAKQIFTLGGGGQFENVLFVCSTTLKPHVCGEDLCSGAYLVGAHGRTCVLTGQLVGADGSNLSHGWREDEGRRNWEGVSVRVGCAAYGECFRPGDEGHAPEPPGGKRARRRAAPAARPSITAPALLDACARQLRELFPGSGTRVQWERARKCVAATKAIVAIERYLRVARSANQAVCAMKVDAISYRFCSGPQTAACVPLDDVEAHLLALGYCAIAAEFLECLLPESGPSSAFVAFVAFLYLQREGVQAMARVLIDRDALLRLLLPPASSLDRFGVPKGAFTAAKNRIQAALRRREGGGGTGPRTGGHTVAQVLRAGAALGDAIDQVEVAPRAATGRSHGGGPVRNPRESRGVSSRRRACVRLRTPQRPA